ncbi:MAG: DUF1330 domain-containing protein [Candidatus Latescibacterota bacterium]|nr:DUF1330 domain-containing protein [Candidatus Latescibacterota bacterium]
MPSYLIVNVDVHDSAKYETYKTAVVPLVNRHGGEYLVRGGKHEVIEGDWDPVRIVLFRFPDRASIQAFIDDPDYQPLKQLRHSIATTEAVVVDGIA